MLHMSPRLTAGQGDVERRQGSEAIRPADAEMPFAPCTSTAVKFHPWSKTPSDSFSSCLHLRVPQQRNQVSYPSVHTHAVSHHAF